MWAEKIHNLQVRRLNGNDLEYLNLNLSLHYAKFFMILLEESFRFELSFSGEEDEEIEDFESYELNVHYQGNNIERDFDINHFMFWKQKIFYKELISEKFNLEENNDNGLNDENINLLNEVLDLINDIKNSDAFDNFVDAISMNLFYGHNDN